MTLGPTQLSVKKCPTRMVLRRGDNRARIKRYHANSLDWSDASLSGLRGAIRRVLRVEQDGRCVYCRRRILIERRNAYEDIEHFLDKKKYRKWTFTHLNLALACRPCNMVKGMKDLGTPAVLGAISYPTSAIGLAWLHPFLDEYHSNIEIGKGWTYKVKANAPGAVRAAAMITGCGLAEVETIEAHAEAIKRHMLRLTVLAEKAAKRKHSNIVSALLSELRSYQERHWFDL